MIPGVGANNHEQKRFLTTFPPRGRLGPFLPAVRSSQILVATPPTMAAEIELNAYDFLVSEEKTE